MSTSSIGTAIAESALADHAVALMSVAVIVTVIATVAVTWVWLLRRVNDAARNTTHDESPER